MVWKEIIEKVQSQFETAIATPYSVQTQYNNDGTFELDHNNLGPYNCWCRHYVLLGQDEQRELGNNPAFRVPSVAIAQLLTLLNKGEGDILTLADLIGNAFRRVAVDGITYTVPSIGNGFRDRDWWRVDVNYPFHADYFSA